ncbi:hypothetical protein EXE58_09265 [Nocardioides seonyuensis]|uniref:Glycosyl transferase family 28 C-terminal domain-containing protein n=1 Tax=Nocardioides seonyuensis TaxID=2518371 RepID=A0A4P7IG64_9ACTN|nr:hypothetical protein [Nocardioides seonyuensis]QBX55623.1 hypothetical protein EXE58_09265 [Nocardioides seonyuensis]
MIGYYVHHHGTGHLHRARTVAAALHVPVTGLSSLPRPADWPGAWVQLPLDDQRPGGYDDAADATARGRLHWVPLRDPGLRRRMTMISAWLDRAGPHALVVDQSVEVCLLARLHGVPVVGLTAPGRRADPAHRLGFDACSELVGAWPEGWTAGMLPGLDPEVSKRFQAVGAVSRFPVRDEAVARRPGPPRAVVLAGTGGDGLTARTLARAQEQTPDWEWTVLSRTLGTWHEDPAAVLADADVAVIAPGQNSLAEVAASRVPAVVVPAPRPFDEQHVTAAVLRQGWPAVVVEDRADAAWRDVLHAARDLDGAAWSRWFDGAAPHRIARLVESVARQERAA